MPYQVCVIGLGRFGAKLATTLQQARHEVMAIDQDNEKVQAMMGRVTYAVQGDGSSSDSLEGLGVADMDVAVVSLGSQVQSSIITTMLLKNLGVPFVMARAINEQHSQILQRVGADKVVFPEEESAERAASLDLGPYSIDFIGITEAVGIHKLRPPESMRGRSLREVGLGADNSRSLIVVVIQRGHEYLVNPDEDETIRGGDILVVVGSHEQIARTFQRPA